MTCKMVSANCTSDMPSFVHCCSPKPSHRTFLQVNQKPILSSSLFSWCTLALLTTGFSGEFLLIIWLYASLVSLFSVFVAALHLFIKWGFFPNHLLLGSLPVYITYILLASPSPRFSPQTSLLNFWPMDLCAASLWEDPWLTSVCKAEPIIHLPELLSFQLPTLLSIQVPSWAYLGF